VERPSHSPLTDIRIKFGNLSYLNHPSLATQNKAQWSDQDASVIIASERKSAWIQSDFLQLEPDEVLRPANQQYPDENKMINDCLAERPS